MFVHAHHDGDAYNYTVIDLDTGEELRFVVWADDSTGDYGVVVMESTTGDFHKPRIGSDGNLVIECRKGNIKIVHKLYKKLYKATDSWLERWRK